MDKLKAWKELRKDIDYEDTPMGFNIVLKTPNGPVTLLAFWGELDQPKVQIIETRQQGYPAFANMGRAEKVRVYRILSGNYFQPTSGTEMNLRLEFATLNVDSLDRIVSAIDEVANLVRQNIVRTFE